MTDLFQHDSPDSAKAIVALLRLLLEEEGSEVSDVSLSLNVGPEYRAAIEKFKKIGFSILERSERHAGRTSVYFSLDRNFVTQELPLVMLRVYDIWRFAERLSLGSPISPGEWERILECPDDEGIWPEAHAQIPCVRMTCGPGRQGLRS